MVTDTEHGLSEILDRITDGFIALDKNWCYTYMNKRAGEILNRDPQQMIGKHIWTEFPEGIGQPFHKAYEQAMTEQKYIFLEEYYPPLDRWFENHIYPSPNGVSVYFRCITEKKKQELKLKTSETKYRSVVENIHESLVVEDVDGNLVYANNEFSKMFGFSKDELRNLSLIDYTAPESYPEVLERHIQRMKGIELPEEFEYKGMRKDGTEIWVDCRVSAILSEGRIVGTQSLERDITERKKAEEKLIEKELQYRLLIEHASDGIFISDLNEHFLDANSSACELIGYSKEELLKLVVDDLVIIKPGETPSRFDEIKSGIRIIQERNLRRKDGSMVPVEVTAKMLPDKRILSIVRDVTERKKNDEKLAESENRLRTIIQTEPECIKLIGPNCELLEMNPAGLIMIEADNIEQVINRSVLDLINEKYRDAFARLTSEVFNGNPGSLEFEITTLKGTHRWLEIHAVPLRDIDGKIISLLGITRDITERKKAEEEILKSRKQFQSLVENIPGVYWVNDLDTYQTLYISPSYETIWGRRVEDLYNNPADFINSVHPEDKALLFEAHKNIANTLKTNITYRIVRPDGELRWISAKTNVVIDSHGKKTEYGYAEDITERKKTEQAIKESEEKFRTLVESSPVGIFLFQPDGQVTYGNPADMRMTGLTWEETMGLNWIKAIHPDDLATVMEDWKKASDSGKPYAGTGRYLHEDGTVVYWDVSTAPTIIDGKIIGYIGTVTDITERKKSEQEIVHMNEQLRDLSSHLQNIREEERKKIAREIHDELGQQLTVIKMNLHSLLKKNNNQDSEFTGKAAAIGEYINQTMDTVRKISSELRPVILDDFGIADALQLHSSEFAKRTGIPCAMKVEGNEIIPDINISTQVFRIYQEALTNVARHSKATQVNSTLKSENGILKILIRDNGKGFNPEKISGKKSLGLIMMRERAIGIGGTLEIASNPGQGTSVIFSLPLAKQ
ncbi:MAG TPA: PAS domain S-box protein [Bacteroidia bacterium]|nr:PAS domain S-box protein [Bacteroidia bacterium]